MSEMAEDRPYTWPTRPRVRRGHAPPSSISRSKPRRTVIRGNSADRLLSPLRRHWRWTVLGLLVAAVAAATRFAAVGVLPPSITLKAFARATGTTELVVGKNPSFTHSVPDTYFNNNPPRRNALADMVASPEVAKYVARAAGLPASKIEASWARSGPSSSERKRGRRVRNAPVRSSSSTTRTKFPSTSRRSRHRGRRLSTSTPGHQALRPQPGSRPRWATASTPT